jgi:hypothetical protein
VRYAAFKKWTISWTQRWLWELAVGQIVSGLLGLVLAYAFRTHEPPSVLWMSSAALVWSGITTMAVAVVVDQVASQ